MLRAEFHATRARGYAINDGDIEPSAVAMAAAIVSRQGVPHGALVLSFFLKPNLFIDAYAGQTLE